MKPACHNRPAYAPTYTRHGIDQYTGKRITVEVRADWASPGCKTWSGVGIGRPTEKYPNGVPYPMAHGYDCRGCCWLPDEHKEDV